MTADEGLRAQNFNSCKAWDEIWEHEDGAFSWRTYPGTFRVITKILVQVTAKGPPLRVLELGSGVGILSARMKRAGLKVMGVDISQFAVKEAERVFGIPGIIASVPPIPFTDKEFDWIVSAHMLEHLSFETGESLVRESARVAPCAIFCVPDNILPKTECKEHEVTYTEASLVALLEKYYNYVYIATFRDTFGTTINNKVGVIDIPVILAICSDKEL